MNNDNSKETINPPPYQNPPPNYGFTNPMVFQYHQQGIPVNTASPYTHYFPGSNVVLEQPRFIATNLTYMESPEAASINDYMPWSIFNILCCGLALGIVAVFMSFEVKQRKMRGDIQGARSLSKGTAFWNLFTTIVGIAIIIGVCIYLSSNDYF